MRNFVLLIIIYLVIFNCLSYSTIPNSPTFTGDPASDFAANEWLGEHYGLHYYLTWDNSYVYLAVRNGTSNFRTNWWSNGLVVVFDTDVGGSNGSLNEPQEGGASGDGLGYAFNTCNDGNHKPDYCLVWENSDWMSNGQQHFMTVSSGAWQSPYDPSFTQSIGWHDVSGVVEIRIPWTSLGSAGGRLSSFAISMWIIDSDGTNDPFSIMPNNNTNGTRPQQMQYYRYYSSTADGIIPNSDFVNQALPVELTSFTASVKGKVVTLDWETATEVNNYGFEIQKSEVRSQESEWKTIGFVEGNGNSNSPKSYSFTDNTASYGSYAYRLKQIDNDGSFDYSNVVEVFVGELPNGFVLEQNYPNPFNPSTKIKFEVEKQSEGTLKVFNTNGEEVAELFSGRLDAGRIYEVEFSASDQSFRLVRNLTSGVYFYQLQTPERTEVKKMMLLK